MTGPGYPRSYGDCAWLHAATISNICKEFEVNFGQNSTRNDPKETPGSTEKQRKPVVGNDVEAYNTKVTQDGPKKAEMDQKRRQEAPR